MLYLAYPGAGGWCMNDHLLGESLMIKIDGAYIFQFGLRMRPVTDIPEEERGMFDMYLSTDDPRTALLEFMLQSVFREELGPVQKSATTFLEELDKYNSNEPMSIFEDKTKVYPWSVRTLKEKYREFEHVLNATLQMSSLYYVSPKGGYNTQYLTDLGDAIFPKELAAMVPGAIPDVKQATRCIAFELPTAAGFHLHRANESVLRAYWDSVTGGMDRPTEGNMGVYLAELNKLNKGKKSVREHLKSIKDFHRNPLMHPEQSLETVEEAIGLMAAIRCSIGYMLSEIGEATPALVLVPEQASA